MKKKNLDELKERFEREVKKAYNEGYELEEISESLKITKQEFDSAHNLVD